MRVDIKNKTVCPHCGHTVLAGNFCTDCAGKLVKECDCWVLRRKFNCGLEKCPGYKLLVLLLKKAKNRKMTDVEAMQLLYESEILLPDYLETEDISLFDRLKRFLKLTDWFEIMLRIMLIVIIIMFLCSASIFFYELYCKLTF